jgi:hypothetical protein
MDKPVIHWWEFPSPSSLPPGRENLCGKILAAGLSCFNGFETFEKWLRRVSKIFPAKKMLGPNDDILKAGSVTTGKAENI